jgi:hypothetical protein
MTLAPGSYRNLTTVNGNPQTPAVLQLSSGDYYFTALTLNADAIVRANPDTRIFVSGGFVFASRVSIRRYGAGVVLAPVYIGLSGTSPVTMEATFNGTIVAPARQVTFGVSSGLTFIGAFYADRIVVQPDSVLVCAGGAPAVP